MRLVNLIVRAVNRWRRRREARRIIQILLRRYEGERWREYMSEKAYRRRRDV